MGYEGNLGSFRRAVTFSSIGLAVFGTAYIADCHQENSGDNRGNDNLNIFCEKVKIENDVIVGSTELSTNEIKALPSPFPPDIICVDDRSAGFITPKLNQ